MSQTNLAHREDEARPAAQYRDLVIATLADSEAALLERIVSLERDVVRYRALAQASINMNADLTGKLKALKAQHLRLRDEFRSVRERLAHEAEVVTEAAERGTPTGNILTCWPGVSGPAPKYRQHHGRA